ncbi:MAG: hypothetical protein U1F43_00310 [Myxococcota bacterium]
MMRSVLTGVFFALVATASACDDKEDFFHDCPLSQTIITACAEEQENADITCAVKAHPMCDEGVCAKFRGSESFCSRVCSETVACPTGSSCQPYLDYAFCVPDEVLNPTVAP